MDDKIILKMTGIEKRFKGVYALKNFNFSLKEGEMIRANNEYRKLPVGIQSFNVIREEGYLYVELDFIPRHLCFAIRLTYLMRLLREFPRKAIFGSV